MHGAWLHLLTDALGSVAALAAGGLIWAFGWNWADPVASMLIGLLVIYSSWNLVKQAIAILMESTPGHLDVDAVRSAMASAPGVCEVHDLHIWTITSGMESLSAHVVLAAGHEAPRGARRPAPRAARSLRASTTSRSRSSRPASEECRTSF